MSDCNGDSGSRKLVEKTVLNGFGKLNGNGQSMVREIELLCGRTKDKGGKIVDFVEQLHSRGLREDMLSKCECVFYQFVVVVWWGDGYLETHLVSFSAVYSFRIDHFLPW